MNQEELCFTPATQLTRMIRDKRVSPVEVMQATLERAQALNPRFNALCTPLTRPLHKPLVTRKPR